MNADDASAFDLLNGARRDRGLAELRWDKILAAYAREHTHRMGARDELFHGDLDAWLKERDKRPIIGWGENIGAGKTVADLERAFMLSPEHKRNILRKGYVAVGIGVIRRDGITWETQVFR